MPSLNLISFACPPLSCCFVKCKNEIFKGKGEKDHLYYVYKQNGNKRNITFHTSLKEEYVKINKWVDTSYVSNFFFIKRRMNSEKYVNCNAASEIGRWHTWWTPLPTYKWNPRSCYWKLISHFHYCPIERAAQILETRNRWAVNIMLQESTNKEAQWWVRSGDVGGQWTDHVQPIHHTYLSIKKSQMVLE